MTGAELKAIRAALDISTAELAARLGGYTRRTVQLWEKGHHPIPPAVVVLAGRMRPAKKDLTKV